MSMGGTEIKKEKSDSTIVVPGDRFVRELELVQSLASPEYLHCKLGVDYGQALVLALGWYSDIRVTVGY